MPSRKLHERRSKGVRSVERVSQRGDVRTCDGPVQRRPAGLAEHDRPLDDDALLCGTHNKNARVSGSEGESARVVAGRDDNHVPGLQRVTIKDVLNRSLGRGRTLPVVRRRTGRGDVIHRADLESVAADVHRRRPRACVAPRHERVALCIHCQCERLHGAAGQADSSTARISGQPVLPGNQARLGLEISPGESEHRFGVNGGAGIRIGGGPVAVMAEARVFYFKEYELRFRVDDAPQLVDQLLEGVDVVRFEPVFVNAQAGLVFKF